MGHVHQGWTCLIFFSIHGYLNNIYYEELISREGFSDIFTNVYHLRMPTRISDVGQFISQPIEELNDVHRWTEDAIRMQLEAGDHQLRVYKLGEIVDEQIIVADQPLTFQYYLKRGVVIKP